MSILRIFTILAVFLASISSINASTITYIIGSHPTSENTATDQVFASGWSLHPDPAIAIQKNFHWADPFEDTHWLSRWNTGDPSSPGFVEVPNGTTISFSHFFKLPIGFVVESATLSVMADDTTSGHFNGHDLFPANYVPGTYCAAGPPGCLLSTMWTGVINPAWFAPNTLNVFNGLSFPTVQTNLAGIGADWRGVVVGHMPDVPTPEPLTFVMVGGGLIFFGIVRRKKTGT